MNCKRRETFSDNHLVVLTDAKLLQPDDRVKDQTLFLSQIPQIALRRTMFPLARILKPTVKRIASEIGLDSIFRNKRESAGICMIGKRKFSSFIDEVDTIWKKLQSI